MTKPGLVIFDCDGVLIDSELIGARVAAEEFARIGLPIAAAEVLARFVGIAAKEMYRIIELEHGRTLPPAFADRVQARIDAAFERELEAIPGIHQVLDELDVSACVASSSTLARLRHSLGLTGLYERFAPHLYSAEQVARGKPAPDLFLYAAAKMRRAPTDCLVIEDSISGVRAAVAAGMRVWGFTGGGHCPPDHAASLRAAGAETVLEHISDLTGSLG